MMDFGFTNDDSRFAAAIAWREAAAADGWSIEPTYKTEPVESAARLRKDGFVAQVIARRNAGKWKYQACVDVWGPDELAIAVPVDYDWGIITKALRHCIYCHKDDVETERVGFAGRCCATCLPEIRKSAERSGWCD